MSDTDVLTDFYDKDAERFWDPRQGIVGRDVSIYPLLAGMSGRVLEYGAGSGSLLLALALEPRFTSVVGVDISQRAIEKIRKYWEEMSDTRGLAREKLAVLTPVNDRLPGIPDNSVDLLLSLDTIEHVMDPYVVLDELYRIAAPGAHFVISVPNYGYIKYVIQLLLGRQPITGGGQPVDKWRHSGWDGWHLHTFTRQSLGALLNDTGWEPLRWTGYRENYTGFGLGYLSRTYPALWSGALTVVSRKKDGPPRS
ncbi:MAG TPA: class I SAM-dependent methyltransferase [Candidatus Binatia bacterium]|nr:class I SAM-dependent methyltransferase [Candidatus Binatia bacterium]